ncbi:hypothetical protein Gotur_026048 [Gossypium turneri]
MENFLLQIFVGKGPLKVLIYSGVCGKGASKGLDL